MEDHEKIAEFRKSVAAAVSLLPTNPNEMQRQTILSAALIGLHRADLPEYSRAINLLMGQKDREILVRDGFVFKETKRGRMRIAKAWKKVALLVDRT